MRTGKNYSAWNLHHSAFPEKGELKEQLLFFARYGILAPSSHNSQPWTMQIGEHSIVIGPSQERLLPVCDASQKLFYTSLGCVIENIVTAAAYVGFGTSVEPVSGDGWGSVQIVFQQRSEQSIKGYQRFHSIVKRETNRNRYLDKEIPGELLEFLQCDVPDDMEVRIISSKSKRKELTDHMFAFRLKAFENTDFRKEMSKYKRTNYTKKGTGIPGFTMGFPDVLSLFAPTVIRYVNVMKFLERSEKALLVEHTPYFVFIAAQGNTPKDWIKSGRLFQRFALEALRHDVHTAYNALPPKVDEIQHMIGSHFQPQVFFRLGYPEKISGHSPRLSISKFFTI